MAPRPSRHLAFALGTALCLVASGTASASESDLRSGLADLRAGAQLEAEQRLLRYRDAAPDADVRRSIDRVLPLLRRPLPEDVREYLATTIEEVAGAKATALSARLPPNYLSRMFPVFP